MGPASIPRLVTQPCVGALPRALEPWRKREVLRRHDGRSYVELDQRVSLERDRPRVALEPVAIHIRGHAPLRRPDLVRSERLLPDVEVVAERVDALDG